MLDFFKSVCFAHAASSACRCELLLQALLGGLTLAIRSLYSTGTDLSSTLLVGSDAC